MVGNCSKPGIVITQEIALNRKHITSAYYLYQHDAKRLAFPVRINFSVFGTMVEVRWLLCQPLKAAITRLSNYAYLSEPCSLNKYSSPFLASTTYGF